MPDKERHEISAELCRKRNAFMKGKTYEQLYGSRKAAILRAKQKARARKLASRIKGRTWEERFGAERAKLLKEKMKSAMGFASYEVCVPRALLLPKPESWNAQRMRKATEVGMDG